MRSRGSVKDIIGLVHADFGARRRRNGRENAIGAMMMESSDLGWPGPIDSLSMLFSGVLLVESDGLHQSAREDEHVAK